MNKIQIQFASNRLSGAIDDLIAIRDQVEAIPYTSDILSVDSSGAVAYDILTPQNVVVELLSGDEVFVSIDGGVTYPFSLSTSAEYLSAPLSAEAPPQLHFTTPGSATIRILLSSSQMEDVIQPS
jgi:hypothetical protein